MHDNEDAIQIESKGTLLTPNDEVNLNVSPKISSQNTKTDKKINKKKLKKQTSSMVVNHAITVDSSDKMDKSVGDNVALTQANTLPLQKSKNLNAVNKSKKKRMKFLKLKQKQVAYKKLKRQQHQKKQT